jgi:diadenylate cyclase
LLKGLLVFALLYAISALGGLRSVSFLIRYLFQYGAIALIIMFQPELRRTLEEVGRSKIPGMQLFYNGDIDEENTRWNTAIKAIVGAVGFLSKRRIGALIVIERQTKLGEIIKTGTLIDSLTTSELIENIFFPNSPLHDGAMIIRDGKIYAAGCLLPLSDSQTISREMGTRHRAGLGMRRAIRLVDNNCFGRKQE